MKNNSTLSELPNISLEDDMKYFEHKRNQRLDRFIRLIQIGSTFDRIDDAYKSLIRIQKQLKLIEDSLIVYKRTYNNG